MKRREFIALVGGVAMCPLAVRAQQPAVQVIGYLSPSSVGPTAHRLAAFRNGLSESGYFEGRNVAIEFRWPQTESEPLPEVAADLARHRVAVIVAPLSTSAALAAKAATTTIPIVFATGSDPVQAGFVTSLSRPGGNVTGVVTSNVEVAAKRLGLLQELLPGATRFAVLVNPNNPVVAEVTIKDAHSAAWAKGRQIEVLTASTDADIDMAFKSIVEKRIEALLLAPDLFFTSRGTKIRTLEARHRVPTIHSTREQTEAGGLMSYGVNQAEIFRLVGVYTGRVLKGENPAHLPVLQPATFEFVINLSTARTLDLAVPQSLLASATEIIE
jgi:putative ABC transport system substrate-binding protein